MERKASLAKVLMLNNIEQQTSFAACPGHLPASSIVVKWKDIAPSIRLVSFNVLNCALTRDKRSYTFHLSRPARHIRIKTYIINSNSIFQLSFLFAYLPDRLEINNC